MPLHISNHPLTGAFLDAALTFCLVLGVVFLHWAKQGQCHINVLIVLRLIRSFMSQHPF